MVIWLNNLNWSKQGPRSPTTWCSGPRGFPNQATSLLDKWFFCTRTPTNCRQIIIDRAGKNLFHRWAFSGGCMPKMSLLRAFSGVKPSPSLPSGATANDDKEAARSTTADNDEEAVHPTPCLSLSSPLMRQPTATTGSVPSSPSRS